MESRERVLLPLLPLLAALLLVPMVQGLTTFGTQNKASPKPNHAQPVKGRECTKHDECAGIRNTKCRQDPRDSKLRCLCADKMQPENGVCKVLALHKECKNDKDCMPGSECVSQMMYSTSSDSSTPSSHNSNMKTCQCKDGFLEDNEECNGGFKTSIPSIYEILLITIGSILLVVH